MVKYIFQAIFILFCLFSISIILFLIIKFYNVIRLPSYPQNILIPNFKNANARKWLNRDHGFKPGSFDDVIWKSIIILDKYGQYYLNEALWEECLLFANNYLKGERVHENIVYDYSELAIILYRLTYFQKYLLQNLDNVISLKLTINFMIEKYNMIDNIPLVSYLLSHSKDVLNTICDVPISDMKNLIPSAYTSKNHDLIYYHQIKYYRIYQLLTYQISYNYDNWYLVNSFGDILLFDNENHNFEFLIEIGFLSKAQKCLLSEFDPLNVRNLKASDILLYLFAQVTKEKYNYMKPITRYINGSMYKGIASIDHLRLLIKDSGLFEYREMYYYHPETFVTMPFNIPIAEKLSQGSDFLYYKDDQIIVIFKTDKLVIVNLVLNEVFYNLELKEWNVVSKEFKTLENGNIVPGFAYISKTNATIEEIQYLGETAYQCNDLIVGAKNISFREYIIPFEIKKKLRRRKKKRYSVRH